jgi:alkylation response protein AidB-like acyl-CoA dehydrogenase
MDAAEALNQAELDLLRSTARDAFGAGIGLDGLGGLGLLGLLTPEDRGGAGWRVVEACAVAVEAGRSLTSLPWSGNLLAAAVLAEAQEALGDPDLLGRLLDGSTVAAAAGPSHDLAFDDSGLISGNVAVTGSTRPDVAVLSGEDSSALAVVDLGGSGVLIRPLGGGVDTTRETGLASIVAAPATRVNGAAALRLLTAQSLLACADTIGALSANVEQLTEYLCGREAFGQPLASFQVIQHRLVDLTLLVEAADGLLWSAARSLAARQADAPHQVKLLHTYLASRGTAALDDAIQLAGGTGFTWEWPLHQAMRRVLVNSAVWPPEAGPVPTAGSVPGSYPGTEAFRQRVRAVIAADAPYEAREGHRAPETPEQELALRRWYRSLYGKGLIGASWPPEWGGRPDYRPAEDLIVTEELIRARAPRPIDQVGLASHVLLRFGTAEQKTRYLPPIRAAEHIWCQLFSEPGAGSDLAGIRARATQREDGHWVLTGQKTWTTDAHWAQFGLALLRTSSAAGRHDGITAFIVPMDSPGLQVQPKQTISGAYEFNDVFLDGVVLTPEQAVGEVGQGWAVAMSGLELERLTVGGNVVLLELLLEDVVAVAQAIESGGLRLADRPEIADRIAALAAEFAAARCFLAGHVERALAGGEQPAEGPIAKILFSETYNRIARFGVELVTWHLPTPKAAAESAQRLQDAWLWSRALTISGGSSEIMRNIIARRRLRLPSARRS